MILGGGIAGLSAGWRWTRAGLEDYRLLELESEVGGNSRALSYPASKAPIGAHYLPLPNEEARAVRRLLQEMGLLRPKGDGWELAPEHLCHSRQERLFYKGAWSEDLIPAQSLTEAATDQMARFKAHIGEWSKKRDAQGRKVFALPLHYSSDLPEYRALDQRSFADYAAEQGWDDPFLLWYLEYACRDDFGGNLSNCSAWAGLHYFASRDGGGLGSADDVLVWPEGNNRLASYLESQQKGRIETGRLVLSVVSTPKGVQVDYLDLSSNQRRRLECRVALYCLPSFTRAHLLSGESRTEAFVYPPWLTANLVLKRTPLDLEAPGFMAWDNVIYDSPSLGYVVATHQDLNTDPLRPTVWTWYRPFPHDDPGKLRKELLEADWGEWSETILSELEELHPDIRDCCERLDITVLGHGMVRPSVGFVWGEQLKAARQAQGPIFFGHGDLSGMSLFEESQFRGVKAAEESLTHLGRSFESYL